MIIRPWVSQEQAYHILRELAEARVRILRLTEALNLSAEIEERIEFLKEELLDETSG
jgi:hypothetical protein